MVMKTLIIALKIFIVFTILTGIVYPFFITGIVQFIFHSEANGSIVVKDGSVVGSSLIGQQFNSEFYFSSRPSSISYNPLPSGGSNYGLTNEKLKKLVKERKTQFVTFNHLDSLSDVPSEMLFASASGLDPHTSPEAALLQVDRVCLARGFDLSQKQKLIKLIQNNTEGLQFSLFGVKRINILLLNIELDKIKK